MWIQRKVLNLWIVACLDYENSPVAVIADQGTNSSLNWVAIVVNGEKE